MIRICKELGSFSAAHRLMHHEGRCRQLHGHTYTVSVSLASNHLTPLQGDNRMFLDFHAFKDLKDLIWRAYDHKLLLNENDTQGKIIAATKMPVMYMAGDPTVENIAMEIWNMCKTFFLISKTIKNVSFSWTEVTLSVRVWESPDAYAEAEMRIA